MSSLRWGRAVVAIAGLAVGGLAYGFPIAVDGDPADWLLSPPLPAPSALPANMNTGHIARGLAGPDYIGQYVWRDEVTDERTNFTPGGQDSRVDIESFHLTATPTDLFFRVQVGDLSPADIWGDGAPQLRIAIDRTDLDGQGQADLGGFSETFTAPEAAWEALVVTRFGSIPADPGGPIALAPPEVFDPTFLALNDGSAEAAIDANHRCIEIRVPWALIGGPREDGRPLHFTVATFRSNGADDTWQTAEGQSAALDAVTHYGHPANAGDPTGSSNTWTEVSDNVIDYHFAVWFIEPDLGFEPASPLLISEVYPAGAGAVAEEWIEIFNPTITDIDLTGYRIGDEETVGDGEGMFYFPPGEHIAMAEAQVVAHDAETHLGLYGRYSHYEFYASASPLAHHLVPDMIRDDLWVRNQGNLNLDSGDEVLLVDPYSTIVDAVGYGPSSDTPPGNEPFGSVGAGESLSRTWAYWDSNNAPTDFMLVAEPSMHTPDSPSLPCQSPIGSPATPGLPCDNGDACTTAQCNPAGECVELEAIDCDDDADPCTENRCDAVYVLGCYPPEGAGAPCDDPQRDDCYVAACDGLGGCDPSAAIEDDTTYACRISTGPCDPEETCDGIDPACPDDETWTGGETCDDGDLCTDETICDGDGECTGGVDLCLDAGIEEIDAGADAGDDAGEDAGEDAGVDAAVIDGGGASDAVAQELGGADVATGVDGAVVLDAPRPDGRDDDAATGDASPSADATSGDVDARDAAGADQGRTDIAGGSDAAVTPDTGGSGDRGISVDARTTADTGRSGESVVPVDEGCGCEGCSHHASDGAPVPGGFGVLVALVWLRRRRCGRRMGEGGEEARARGE